MQSVPKFCVEIYYMVNLQKNSAELKSYWIDYISITLKEKEKKKNKKTIY